MLYHLLCKIFNDTDVVNIHIIYQKLYILRNPFQILHHNSTRSHVFLIPCRFLPVLVSGHPDLKQARTKNLPWSLQMFRIPQKEIQKLVQLDLRTIELEDYFLKKKIAKNE